MLRKFFNPDGKEIEVEAKDDDELKKKALEYMHQHFPSTENELMLSVANDFHRLTGDLRPKSLDEKGLKGKPIVFLVNASFGLEVYLKLAVRISTNKAARGHKLSALYVKLSSDAKKEIEDMVNRKVQALWPETSTTITGESIAAKVDNAYVEARYAYELNTDGKPKVIHCPMDEICVLLDILGEFCKKYEKTSFSG
jgi:hypothetical protein